MGLTVADKRLLRALFAVGWADGSLSEGERRVLEAYAQGCGGAEMIEAWYEVAPEEPVWEKVSTQDAAGLVREAARVAAADDAVKMGESELLERLRVRLGMSEQEYHAILVEVEQERANRSS